MLLAAAASLRWLTAASQRTLAAAAGMLLGVAFFGLLPEAVELGLGGPRLALALLGGLVLLGLLHAAVAAAHVGKEDRGSRTRVALVLAGDGLHNGVDGVLIAAAFMADPALGWATALGILAHELPQELADFVILLEAGVERRTALLLNALSGGMAVAGGVAGFYLLEPLRAWLPFGMAVAAASFIGIGGSVLATTLRQAGGRREAILRLLLLLTGAALGSVMSVTGGSAHH